MNNVIKEIFMKISRIQSDLRTVVIYIHVLTIILNMSCNGIYIYMYTITHTICSTCDMLIFSLLQQLGMTPQHQKQQFTCLCEYYFILSTIIVLCRGISGFYYMYIYSVATTVPERIHCLNMSDILQ